MCFYKTQTPLIIEFTHRDDKKKNETEDENNNIEDKVITKKITSGLEDKSKVNDETEDESEVNDDTDNEIKTTDPKFKKVDIN